MIKNFTLFCFLLMLNFSVFGQNSDNLSIKVLDRNGDSVTAGIVSLFDSNGKKTAEFRLEDVKKIQNINFAPGAYILEIQSPGFKIDRRTIEIESGLNKFEVRLEVEDVKVDVSVGQDEREKRIEEATSEYLSDAEIAALPESGEDIKEELKKRYGDDILIRIDGDFEGSQIPTRAEISSIKVVRNSFDAEFHEIAGIIIDIRTKVVTKGFHGFGNFSFNNSILNARNPFAPVRQPQRTGNLIAVVSGPIIKNRTSFSLAMFAADKVTTQNFVGTGVDASRADAQKIGQRLALTSLTIKNNLPKNHILDVKYQNSTITFKNFGIGAFDLPERAANRSTIQHRFVVSESGIFKKKYANDLRIEFADGTDKTVSKTAETTVLVLNSFNAGGFGSDNRTAKKKIGLTDNLVFDARKHSLKFGAEISYEKLHGVSENNLNGTFVFLNLTDFLNRKPSQFSQTTAKTEIRLSQLRSAFYFQDYFKFNKAVQLSLGVRYELQNDLQDKNNFSPRVGYVWSPEKSGKFILRGGIGLFYNWLDTSVLSAILSNDGRQGRKIIIKNPSFPDPFGGGAISQILPPSISRLAADLQTPSVFAIQNGFNYKFSKSLTLEGIYNFRRSLHDFRSRNVNAPRGGIRPNAGFGIIQLLESSGVSQENSLELKTNCYFKKINWFANYELSKNTADFSGALNLPTNNYDVRLDRGLTDADQTHKINVGFNFDVLKKINVAPSLRLESGLPYSVTTGKDDNGDTVFNDRPDGIGRNTERGELLKQVDVRFRWKLPMKFLGVKETDKRKFLSLNANVRNLLNISNLTNYVGIQTSPSFRQPTFARSARSLELGLSFGF